MDDTGLHTLDELAELVEAALSVDYRGAPTGRVRDVPDQRAIRWYVTRGLVDRPVASRGRIALYGRRHLLQLVAIKRRQAQGRSLAEIQAELTGATDDALATVARLTAEPTPTPPPAPATTRAVRFWTDRAAAPAPKPAPAPAPPELEQPDTVLLHGIRLAPGVTLLIENGARPDPAAVLAAARPLLDLINDPLAAGGPAPEETP